MATIQVTHHDWRTDERAVTQPWGVAVDGTVVARAASVNAAGDVARQIAAECADAEIPARVIFASREV